MAGEDAKVRMPALRDVLRHLVHHAPDLSPEMRDQYRDAIDQAYPPEPEALPAPEAPEHPEDGQLPPPPG